jgi:ABC-type Zn uptake system ZnuABC Zn-binding protein ZnuA
MKNLCLLYIVTLAVVVLGGAGCKNRDSEPGRSEIAVTNSYLQCVVKDLCPESSNVLCLAPPGMCPGHFDISPAEVNQLCKCRILLLFDFQKGIENSLLRIKDKGLKMGSVRALPGLCMPETYLAACQDVCSILSAEYPDRRGKCSKRLKLIEERLENLSNELSAKIQGAGLESAKVLASSHQAQFAKWLGLETIATFVGSDTETVSNINQCLEKARADTTRFIIANKQEGTGLADALAERLGAKVAVFSNFPDVSSGQNGFDRLLRENVQALLEAAK